MADVEKIAAELRAGLDACTSGPWSVDDRIVAPGDIGESWAVFESCEDDPPIIMCMEWQQEANARHIARCHPENIRALLDELSRLREVERMAKEATRPFLEVDIALSRAHLQGHLGAGDLVLASVEAVRVASDLYRALSTQVEERE